MCPEYRRNVSDSSDESSSTPDIESGTGNGIQEAETPETELAETESSRLEKKFNQIESSTDTLVPELDNSLLNGEVTQ